MASYETFGLEYGISPAMTAEQAALRASNIQQRTLSQRTMWRANMMRAAQARDVNRARSTAYAYMRNLTPQQVQLASGQVQTMLDLVARGATAEAMHTWDQFLNMR